MKQDWEIKKLSDIGKVFNGNSINEKVKKDNYTNLDNGYPFIATKDVGFDSEIDYANGVKIPFSERKQFKIAPANTPLICAEGGSAGRKIGFTNQDVSFGNKLFALVSNKNVDSKFIFYYYFNSSFQKHFTTEMTGIIGGVSMNKFKDIEIPIPPLPEQQRIVAILDEAFAAIAKAKANAQQNLQNAKELFDGYLHKYFTNKEEGWEEKKLKDFAEYFNGLTYSPKDVSDKGIIVLRSSNIQNDELDFDDIVRVNLKVKEKIIVKDGDILMCSRNGSKRLVGKTAPIANLDEVMTFGTFMMIVRSEYNPYLLWFFKSTDFKSQISGGENTMINQITRYMLDEIVVSFPPIEKQNEIVKQLNAIDTEIQKLESIYNKKLNDLEELKKSVLQKAFSGELKMEKELV